MKAPTPSASVQPVPLAEDEVELLGDTALGLVVPASGPIAGPLGVADGGSASKPPHHVPPLKLSAKNGPTEDQAGHLPIPTLDQRSVGGDICERPTTPERIRPRSISRNLETHGSESRHGMKEPFRKVPCIVSPTSSTTSTSLGSTTFAMAHRASITRGVRKSRRRIVRVCQNQLQALFQPMNPTSSTMRFRAGVVLLALFIQVLFVPFTLSYVGNARNNRNAMKTTIAVNIGVEVVMLLDFLLLFNTAIPVANTSHSGQQTDAAFITDRSQVMSHITTHQRSTLAIDGLGVVPLELLQVLLSRASPLQPIIHSYPKLYFVGIILRFLQFRRLSLLLKLMNARQASGLSKDAHSRCLWSYAGFGLEIFACMFCVIHLLACAWNGVLIRSSNVEYPMRFDGLSSMSITATYVHDLVTITQFAFGRATETLQTSTVTPTSVALMELFATISLGALMAAMTAKVVVWSLNNNASDHEKLAFANAARHEARIKLQMTALELPEELQRRVLGYHRHLWQTYRIVDGDLSAFTRNLPASIALNIGLCRYASSWGRLRLWSRCSTELISAAIAAIEPRIYLENDHIVRAGEFGSEMVVIQRGRAELQTNSLSPSTVSNGAIFGQLSLIVAHPRGYSVRAVEIVDASVLTRQSFQELLNSYTEDRERLVRRILCDALESNEYPSLGQSLGTEFLQQHDLKSPTTSSQSRLRRTSARIAAKHLVRLLKVDKRQPLHLPVEFHCQDIVKTLSDKSGRHGTSSTSTNSGVSESKALIETLIQLTDAQSALSMKVAKIGDSLDRLELKMQEAPCRPQREAVETLTANPKAVIVSRRRRRSIRTSAETKADTSPRVDDDHFDRSNAIVPPLVLPILPVDDMQESRTRSAQLDAPRELPPRTAVRPRRSNPAGMLRRNSYYVSHRGDQTPPAPFVRHRSVNLGDESPPRA